MVIYSNNSKEKQTFDATNVCVLSMNVIKTEIPGVLIIETDVFEDQRGFFTETYNKPKYETLGITTEFVQDNMSYSLHKGTLRGLHWQNPPYAQAKIVSCSKGRVMDVAVDIRKGSPTFGRYVMVELSAENHRQFFIPRGFAHAVLTMTDDVEFRYKCDNVYNKASEGGMRYDAPEIGIDWESLLNGIKPVLSEKDQTGPALKDANNQFIYGVNC